MWAECLVAIRFDVEEGPVVDYVSPPRALTPEGERNVVTSAFPDSNFECESHFIYYFTMRNMIDYDALAVESSMKSPLFSSPSSALPSSSFSLTNKNKNYTRIEVRKGESTPRIKSSLQNETDAKGGAPSSLGEKQISLSTSHPRGGNDRSLASSPPSFEHQREAEQPPKNQHHQQHSSSFSSFSLSSPFSSLCNDVYNPLHLETEESAGLGSAWTLPNMEGMPTTTTGAAAAAASSPAVACCTSARHGGSACPSFFSSSPFGTSAGAGAVPTSSTTTTITTNFGVVRGAERTERKEGRGKGDAADKVLAETSPAAATAAAAAAAASYTQRKAVRQSRLFGCAYYRQKRDPEVPRGSVQQVFVLLSTVPYHVVHELALRVVVPCLLQCCSLSPDLSPVESSSALAPYPTLFFPPDSSFSPHQYTQEAVMDRAYVEMSRWPPPHPRMYYEVQLLHQVLYFVTPCHPVRVRFLGREVNDKKTANGGGIPFKHIGKVRAGGGRGGAGGGGIMRMVGRHTSSAGKCLEGVRRRNDGEGGRALVMTPVEDGGHSNSSQNTASLSTATGSIASSTSQAIKGNTEVADQAMHCAFATCRLGSSNARRNISTGRIGRMMCQDGSPPPFSSPNSSSASVFYSSPPPEESSSYHKEGGNASHHKIMEERGHPHSSSSSGSMGGDWSKLAVEGQSSVLPPVLCEASRSVTSPPPPFFSPFSSSSSWFSPSSSNSFGNNFSKNSFASKEENNNSATPNTTVTLPTGDASVTNTTSLSNSISHGQGPETRSGVSHSHELPCVIPLFALLHSHLGHLTRLWELVISHQSIGILSDTSACAAGVAHAISALIAPLRFTGKLYSHLTSRHEDIERLRRLGKQIPFSDSEGIIVACTNRMLFKSFQAWPSWVIALDEAFLLPPSMAVEGTSGELLRHASSSAVRRQRLQPFSSKASSCCSTTPIVQRGAVATIVLNEEKEGEEERRREKRQNGGGRSGRGGDRPAGQWKGIVSTRKSSASWVGSTKQSPPLSRVCSMVHTSTATEAMNEAIFPITTGNQGRGEDERDRSSHTIFSAGSGVGTGAREPPSGEKSVTLRGDKPQPHLQHHSNISGSSSSLSIPECQSTVFLKKDTSVVASTTFLGGPSSAAAPVGGARRGTLPSMQGWHMELEDWDCVREYHIDSSSLDSQSSADSCLSSSWSGEEDEEEYDDDEKEEVEKRRRNEKSEVEVSEDEPWKKDSMTKEKKRRNGDRGIVEMISNRSFPRSSEAGIHRCTPSFGAGGIVDHMPDGGMLSPLHIMPSHPQGGYSSFFSSTFPNAPESPSKLNAGVGRHPSGSFLPSAHGGREVEPRGPTSASPPTLSIHAAYYFHSGFTKDTYAKVIASQFPPLLGPISQLDGTRSEQSQQCSSNYFDATYSFVLDHAALQQSLFQQLEKASELDGTAQELTMSLQLDQLYAHCSRTSHDNNNNNNSVGGGSRDCSPHGGESGGEKNGFGSLNLSSSSTSSSFFSFKGAGDGKHVDPVPAHERVPNNAEEEGKTKREYLKEVSQKCKRKEGEEDLVLHPSLTCSERERNEGEEVAHRGIHAGIGLREFSASTVFSQQSVADDTLRRFFRSLTLEFLRPVDVWFKEELNHASSSFCVLEWCVCGDKKGTERFRGAQFMRFMAQHHRRVIGTSIKGKLPYSSYNGIYEKFSKGVLFESYIQELLDARLRRELAQFSLESWLLKYSKMEDMRACMFSGLLQLTMQEMEGSTDPDLEFAYLAYGVLGKMASTFSSEYGKNLLEEFKEKWRAC